MITSRGGASATGGGGSTTRGGGGPHRGGGGAGGADARRRGYDDRRRGYDDRRGSCNHRRRWRRGSSGLLLFRPLDRIPDHGAADGAEAGANQGAGSGMSGLAPDGRPGSRPDGAAGESALLTCRQRGRAANNGESHAQSQHHANSTHHPSLQGRHRLVVLPLLVFGSLALSGPGPVRRATLLHVTRRDLVVGHRHGEDRLGYLLHGDERPWTVVAPGEEP